MRTVGVGLGLLALCVLCSLKVGATGPRIRKLVETGGLEAEVSGSSYHWALLIAGSNTWWNYRHQADVCHAYQLLKKNGLPDERIIVMLYDDVASSMWNPYPEQLFNKPGGEDVYPGCAKDYTGDAVNSTVFLAVLTGDAAAVEGVGSGRVVDSTSEDRVFVYYADHGGTGVLYMPEYAPPLYADELHSAFKGMAERKAFKELVMYVEACEAGSMFEGILEDDLGVYVVTASNADESSWATYCPVFMDAQVANEGTTVPNATYLGVCMGDLFSVAWLEDTERESITDQTLKCQYQHVRDRTSNGGTYDFGSHVKRYGEKNFQEDPIGDFLGNYNLPPEKGVDKGCVARLTSDRAGISVPQRDARLLQLMHHLKRADTEAVRRATLDDLLALVAERQRVDSSIKKTVQHLVRIGAVAGARNAGNGGDEEFVLAMVQESMGRPRPGVPVVDSFDCLREFVRIWQARCGQVDPDSRDLNRAFVNLCNSGVSPQDFDAAVRLSRCEETVSLNNVDALPVT